MKYYYEHLRKGPNGNPVYLGDIIEIKDRDEFDQVCAMEQEIVDRGKHKEWHKPFIMHPDGTREYFKPNISKS